ncbi:unnamed protein product, partial [Pylaiella littoralis]
VGEDGHRHGGRALWTPLAPVVCGDRSYRHRRYDHFTLSLRQGCAPDDIPLRYRCDGTRVGVQRTAHGKSCLPMRVFKRFRCCPPLLPGCQLGHCRTSDARGNTAADLVVPHTARQGQHDAAPHRARRRPADIAKLGGH